MEPNIPQNILFYVLQKKENHTHLEQHGNTNPNPVLEYAYFLTYEN